MPHALLSHDRLLQLLDAARHVRIAIIGDAMLDVYLRGEVERISPEAPVPVVRVRDRRDALGGAANVAQNVAALGATSELVAAIGDDPAGTQLRTALRGIGALEDGLVTVARPTTTKTRVLARAQQLLRFDEEEDRDLDGPDADRLADAAARAVAAADAVVLEDYNKGVLRPALIEAVITQARAKGIPVVVDPKFRHFFAYRGATVFKPNRRELESAMGAALDLEHADALAHVLAQLQCDHLLLTLGERGMTLLSRDGGSLRIPTTAREVYDVVGAGDTVTAYLAAMLAAGASAPEAAVIANYAAGVEVGKLGAQQVSRDEVLAAFAHD